MPAERKLLLGLLLKLAILCGWLLARGWPAALPVIYQRF